jgi:uncharacterized Fe-S cluster-containing radical SAM superfamily protein
MGGKLNPPQPRVRADYRGSLLAPYKRLGPTVFYQQLAPGGTYTADIQMCPWHCRACWSERGWNDEPVAYELMPQQVVEAMLRGMVRHRMSGSRIAGGDAGYWWAHVRQVIGLFLERTRGRQVMVPDGESQDAHDPVLVIETSGGMMIRPEHLAQIEREFGAECRRLWISIGMKATSGPLLAKLTGLAPGVAEAAHERQLELAFTIATELEHICMLISFLDAFVEQARFEQIRTELDEAMPGIGQYVAVFKYTAPGAG